METNLLNGGGKISVKYTKPDASSSSDIGSENEEVKNGLTPWNTNYGAIKEGEIANKNIERSKYEIQPVNTVDRGWAWVILGAAFASFVIRGTIYSNGIFNVKFLEEFVQSKSLTSWPGSMALGLCTLGGPIASLMNKKFGSRITVCTGGILCLLGNALACLSTSIYLLILTFGILQGMGLCFIHFSSMVVLGYYFKKYRNTAFSIATSGIAAGTIFFPILYANLIEHYGTWGTLLISGAMQFHVTVFGSLMRPIKRKVSNSHLKVYTKKTGRRRSSVMFSALCRALSSIPRVTTEPKSTCPTETSPIKHTDHTNNKYDNRITDVKPESNQLNHQRPSFKEYCQDAFFKVIPRDFVVPCLASTVALCLFGAYSSTLAVHYVAYAEEQGVDNEFGALLLSIMGTGGIAGRVVILTFTNLCNVSVLFLYIFFGFLSSALAFIGPFVTVSYVGHAAFMFSFAVTACVPISLMVPVGMEVFGEDRVVEVTGLLTFMDGLGQLAGPPVAGLFVDKFGSYFSIFPFAGILSLVASATMLYVFIHRKLKANSFEVPYEKL